jgi:hypothetical protein
MTDGYAQASCTAERARSSPGSDRPPEDPEEGYHLTPPHVLTPWSSFALV